MTAPDMTLPPRDGDLTAAERKLLTAAITGILVDLRTGDAARDDPAQAGTWDTARIVRAEVLTGLLTGDRTPEGGRLRAVKLRGARITGFLDLEATTLVCPLLLWECRIDEPVSLADATAPAIRMGGCRLTSLVASQLLTAGNLTLNASIVTGGVRLTGARIGGQLNLDGASLTNLSGWALAADGLTVDGSMFCRSGFTAAGGVNLTGARIGNQLDLAGAALTNPGGRALVADSLTVGQSMFCRGGFTAAGEVRLTGARIGGQLDLAGASLVNPAGAALFADSLTVDGSMFCRDGFTTAGEVRLTGAHVHGQLDLAGASLVNPAGMALFAEGLTADWHMLCRGGFTANGEVNLRGARIGGRLDLTGASLASPGGTALNLDAANVSAFYLLPRQPPGGAVSLTNARVMTFHDDPASWPAVLRLRGFAYDSLENHKVSARSRLGWLTRQQGGYTPQLYDQLATVYRRAGNEQAARKIAVAKQWRRRRGLNPLSWLWYVTVGYGYRTWLAGVWLAALVALGSWVFSRAYPAHMVAIRSQPPAFHPVAYAFDLLLPVIDLGQKSAWQPKGSALLYWSWALTGAGWVLTTAVVAGLTGILKRE